MFAVHGVWIVTVQTALVTLETNLCRPKDRLHQPQKQTDTNDHYDDRKQMARVAV